MGRVLFERLMLGRAYKGLFLRPGSGSVSVTLEKTQQLTPYTLNAMGRVLFERQWLGRAVHRTLGAPVLTSSPGCSARISLTCSHPAFVTLRMSLQLRCKCSQCAELFLLTCILTTACYCSYTVVLFSVRPCDYTDTYKNKHTREERAYKLHWQKVVIIIPYGTILSFAYLSVFFHSKQIKVFGKVGV